MVLFAFYAVVALDRFAIVICCDTRNLAPVPVGKYVVKLLCILHQDYCAVSREVCQSVLLVCKLEADGSFRMHPYGSIPFRSAVDSTVRTPVEA